jgi:predicted ATPase
LVTREVIAQREGQWEIKGALGEDGLGVPENLRQLIEQQLGRLNPDEHKVLEAASVAGAEFSAAAVAAAVEQSVEAVETYCDSLVRREQFLRPQGTSEWPDGTSAARYGFVHALYQDVLYDQLSATRRSRLHRQIGEREEQAYGDRAREIAAELAVHFERGRDYRKTIQYLQYAGENALRRSAHREAINLLTRGLELLKALPDTPERAQQELRLQVALGTSLIVTKGYAAPEVEQAHIRAHELCRTIGETPKLFSALLGLCAFYVEGGSLHRAHAIAEELRRLAQAHTVRHPAFLLWAYVMLGVTLDCLGEFPQAREYFEQSLALYTAEQHQSSYLMQDPGVVCFSRLARVLSLLGYPDQALKRSQEALFLAGQLSHPFNLAYALQFAIGVHDKRGEPCAAQELARTLVMLATQQGFPRFVTIGAILRGWSLAEQGHGEKGIAEMRQGLTALHTVGSKLGQPYYFALLAEAYAKVGQGEEGLSVLAEALMTIKGTRERWYEAELYRLKGELTLQKEFKVQGSKFKVKRGSEFEIHGSESEAETCFLKAIEISRKQQAKSLELRATMSLVRLRQHQAMHYGSRNTQHVTHVMLAEAHKMLSEIYNWFTEGFDTKDLQDAKALIEELNH